VVRSVTFLICIREVLCITKKIILGFPQTRHTAASSTLFNYKSITSIALHFLNHSLLPYCHLSLKFRVSFLGVFVWYETGSIWYVGQYLAYFTSPVLWMKISMEQSVE
jgi:hypothetical protein